MLNIICLSAIVVFLAGCGSSSSTVTNSDDKNKDKLEWNSVPEKFNPQVNSEDFSTHGVESIELSLFGGHRDARVIYSNTLRSGEGVLKLYNVSSGISYIPSLKQQMVESTLQINHFGRYQCSIKIENRKITNLEGKCYVRIEIILPLNSEIEVYNSDKLLTKRFKPMSNQSFIEALKEASFDKNKLVVIDEFLNSYFTRNKTPNLTSFELETVISEVLKTDNKLDILGKLHPYVTDRQNLGQVIDNSFHYYDREKARKIVGL